MNKVIVDTDILLDHVMHADAGAPSGLRSLMGRSFCYTTVFNAIEAFGLCRTDAQRDAVERSMRAMKILGLNAKSGKSIGDLFGAAPRGGSLRLLIAGICTESRLPLVTGRKAAYEGILGLTVLDPGQVLMNGNEAGAEGETK